jgi:hypothetical protein
VLTTVGIGAAEHYSVKTAQGAERGERQIVSAPKLSAWRAAEAYKIAPILGLEFKALTFTNRCSLKKETVLHMEI